MTWIVVLWSLACSGDGDSGDTSAAPPSTVWPPDTQEAWHPTCEAYLDCVAAVAPAQLGDLLDTYGPSGSCWEQGDDVEQTCIAACHSGLEQLEQAYPAEPACDTNGDATPGGGDEIDISWSWDSYDNLTVSITDGPSGGYRLGMAQTGVQNGWDGEDCLLGNVCHTLEQTGGTVLNVTSVAEVMDGYTLFAAEHDSSITFFVETADGSACWVWGDDPSYYHSEDCELL